MKRLRAPDRIIPTVKAEIPKRVTNVGEENPDKMTRGSTRDNNAVAKMMKNMGISSGTRENAHITEAIERMQRKILGSSWP